jgi:pyruvate/2-oxoglutarate dehydrogenase complex dihydrolipoamide acyltransferase (E2) component
MRTAGAALAKLGGAEIAALVGAILEASERDVPVLVDGFVVTAAALVAAAISPAACRVMFFASASGDETGQGAAMAKVRAIARENGIDIQEGPALSMGLRMGEGSGAMLAAPILRSAAEVLNGMGTIRELLSSPQMQAAANAGGGGGGRTLRESERTPTSSSNMTTQTPTRGKRSKSFLASLDDTTSSSDGEEEEEEEEDDDRGLASEKSAEYEQVMRALSP